MPSSPSSLFTSYYRYVILLCWHATGNDRRTKGTTNLAASRNITIENVKRGNNMNAINKSRTQVNTNAQVLDTTGKVTVALIGGTSLLIGLWAVACFAGALMTAGPIGLVQGFISAVTGL